MYHLMKLLTHIDLPMANTDIIHVLLQCFSIIQKCIKDHAAARNIDNVVLACNHFKSVSLSPDRERQNSRQPYLFHPSNRNINTQTDRSVSEINLFTAALIGSLWPISKSLWPVFAKSIFDFNDSCYGCRWSEFPTNQYKHYNLNLLSQSQTHLVEQQTVI